MEGPHAKRAIKARPSRFAWGPSNQIRKNGRIIPNQSSPVPLSPLPVGLNGLERPQRELTTPNCNEVVSWYVLKYPIELSEAQIREYATHYHNTVRPIQPLNGRPVVESQCDGTARGPSSLLGFLVSLCAAPGLVAQPGAAAPNQAQRQEEANLIQREAPGSPAAARRTGRG